MATPDKVEMITIEDKLYFRVMFNMIYRLKNFGAFIICLLLTQLNLTAQTVTQKLQAAYTKFENDPQLKYASTALHVIEASTGKIVFSKNAQTGLAPASTQKIISSITAYEILGKDFRYTTHFLYSSKDGSLTIIPEGDPTLGSHRWPHTKPEQVLKRLFATLPGDITSFSQIRVDESSWENHSIPQGWIWQDLGNYYGAASSKLNWRENQYDILLRSGSQLGDTVKILQTQPRLQNFQLRSEVTAASRGTGDKAYIFFPLNGNEAVVKGTIPVNQNSFSISGAFPDPSKQLVAEIADYLKQERPVIANKGSEQLIHTEVSPSLDSIIYWFNRKSVNLFGEALLQTMSYQKKGLGSVDSGVAVVKNLWRERGIDPLALNILDGSGLSPMNRVTTQAQVAILQYAYKQDWFGSFYNSLPEYNGMKMKSGTIRDVKGYCGYHKSAAGVTYIFSFLVNNYNGSHSGLVNKMFTVLNTLK